MNTFDWVLVIVVGGGGLLCLLAFGVLSFFAKMMTDKVD